MNEPAPTRDLAPGPTPELAPKPAPDRARVLALGADDGHGRVRRGATPPRARSSARCPVAPARRSRALLLSAVVILALWGTALGQGAGAEKARTFGAELSGDAVVPPVASVGRGLAVAVLQGYLLDVTVSFSGLGSPVASDVRGGVHIHRGAAGETGPILFELPATATTSGLLETRVILDDVQRAALLAGELYVQIHTRDHPAGELRGQLVGTAGDAPPSP